jgi:hypothetical protein
VFFEILRLIFLILNFEIMKMKIVRNFDFVENWILNFQKSRILKNVGNRILVLKISAQ